MAYAALVSLEHTTDLILNHQKYSISVDESEHITSIREYITFLISFLNNFPQKANRLEGKITDSAYKAENLIEYFISKQFGLNWWSVGLSRVGFVQQLERVREEIGSITGETMDDRLCDLLAAISSSRVAATIENDVVVGLDADLLAIKDRLCWESSKLEVILIVGMAGIGKTTLARYAYDDPQIMEYFHIRVFVQVSQDYSAFQIISNLLASIKLFEEQISGWKNVSVIAENVYKGLKGRRYLIVMDDIWSTNAWDDVRNIFPDDNNGSRIMLTTRLSGVASYASSGSPLHEMKFMDGNLGWNLLKQKVITDGKNCPPELEDIGKEIVRGCRGLPLAVVVVAGILRTIARTKASWEKLAKNVNSVVDGQVDKILSLSYTLLPHHLRPCFLYMAGFPEDHNVHVSRLIKLWVAEGFLKLQNGYKSLEEEAEEYLEDLVKRNLVLITGRKINGKIKCCSLHDLVRDMCIRKAHEEMFLLTDMHVIKHNRKDERRISFGHSLPNEICGPTIHTILCFQTILDSSSLPFLVSFRLLRVLDVINDYSMLLPPQVFELFHLRYLALGFRNTIPAAISKLENLQTLIFRPWRKSRAYASLASFLPLEIWRMPRLRHLFFAGFYMLPDPADGPTLPLENLQTLSVIASFACSERILKMIPNLKKLGIIYFTNQEHHGLHNLVNLPQLETLKITTSFCFSWQGKNPAFPRTLKKLTLVGGRLPWKDMSILGSLPNLEVLKLREFACDGNTWKTSDGEFVQLKFLLIQGSYLQQWITESLHFPRLKCLVLLHCPNLSQMPLCIGDIPALEVIEVDIWNVSLLKSAKQLQVDQRSTYGNYALQVRCFRC